MASFTAVPSPSLSLESLTGGTSGTMGKKKKLSSLFSEWRSEFGGACIYHWANGGCNKSESDCDKKHESATGIDTNAVKSWCKKCNADCQLSAEVRISRPPTHDDGNRRCQLPTAHEGALVAGTGTPSAHTRASHAAASSVPTQGTTVSIVPMPTGTHGEGMAWPPNTSPTADGSKGSSNHSIIGGGMDGKLDNTEPLSNAHIGRRPVCAHACAAIAI